MKKKPSKGPFDVKGGEIELKHRIYPYPTGDDFFHSLSLRAEGLSTLLEHLKGEIDKFCLENIPLLESKSGQEVIRCLKGDIETAEKGIEDNQPERIGQAMYSIGLAVGKLNHVEGWNKALMNAANLTKGSPRGGEATKKKAADRDKVMRSLAVGWFKQNITKKNKDVISVIKTHLSTKNLAADLSNGTIEKIIADCKKQAEQELENQPTNRG